MSVGDRKGWIRRYRALERKGHTPRKTALDTASLIERNRRIAAKAAASKKKSG